ncbi:hypothetical protein JCM30237_09050 [Halolamina litorea]|uniref:DUF3592 domain-containing protein n=1 Tax=Halolamina litorea TaxID=1515593 RepID=A0ABD6BQ61_9EURY|nr:DUF3592 domain-containing protein [Halolamina litorea]
MSDDGFTVRIGGREVDPVRGGALLLVVGLAVGGFGAYDYQQQQAALDDSVAVNATVQEAGVESVGGASSSGVDYRPTATFTYRYGGENYTSHSVFASASTPNYDTRSAAEAVLADYEDGKAATAYVDPDSPSDAFLVRQPADSPMTAGFIGAVVALLGLGSLLTGYRR